MRKVLVVEDHPSIRDILVRQVGAMGFSVISAENGREGVEKALEERPHLILMDVSMPEIDGREATRIIRSHPNTQHIPVLVATALFLKSELASCVEAGCNDYILKPFTAEELKRKIQKLIPVSSQTIH